MITVQEAKKLHEQNDAQAIVKAEAMIDAALSKYIGAHVRVEFSDLAMSPAALEKVCAMCREAGWGVSVGTTFYQDRVEPTVWVELCAPSEAA